MTHPDPQAKLVARVQEVFRRVFDEPGLRVTDATTAADIPAWDSLTHIGLILALEEEFSVQFSTREVASMQRVGDLHRLLEQKGAGGGGA